MSSSFKLGHESFGLGALFERLDDAILVIDEARSRVVLSNPAAGHLFGYREDDLRDMPLGNLVLGGFRGRTLGRFEVNGLSRDGDPLWLEVSLSPIDNDQAPGRYQLAILRDIGERKGFEAALESSEARFRAFMDVGPAIASMRDEEGRYVYTNALHRRLFGSQDWIGTPVYDRLPEEIAEQVLADDQIVLRTGIPTHFEEQMPGQDQPLTLMVFKFPFQASTGQRLIGSLGVDVTPLKRAQAALVARSTELETANEALRQADSYKDEFLSVLSHELRTPITTINGFIELLEDGAAGDLNEHQLMFVRQVDQAIRRLLALVNDLIDFAQLQAGAFPLNFQRADLAAAVREMAEAKVAPAREAGLTMHLDLPTGPLWAAIDARQIGRVMLNLLDNALKYTAAGGRVTVKAAVQGNWLRTEVSDTGVGISETNVPRLFDRFWQFDTSSTRTGGGLGLGLPIAKAIVEGHGGRIGAHSVEGHGSTFWFELPLESVTSC